MSLHRTGLPLTALCVFFLTCCLSVEAGWDPRKRSAEAGDGESEAAATAKSEFLGKDSSLQEFFDAAWGYAIFPSVGKGGFGIGGAYGKGEVYEKGVYVGQTKLKQFTIGFQIGGQKYREVIFFKSEAALDDFKRGNFELGAQASAVAVTAGASADADYADDIAIFTMTIGGLMYEATVGGQKFDFHPK